MLAAWIGLGYLCKFSPCKLAYYRRYVPPGIRFTNALRYVNGPRDRATQSGNDYEITRNFCNFFFCDRAYSRVFLGKFSSYIVYQSMEKEFVRSRCFFSAISIFFFLVETWRVVNWWTTQEKNFLFFSGNFSIFPIISSFLMSLPCCFDIFFYNKLYFRIHCRSMEDARGCYFFHEEEISLALQFVHFLL